jgi:glutathione S-transferase
MLENHLGWFGVHARWLIPENFAKGPARFFDGLPEALRGSARAEAQARVGEAVRAMGASRHSEPEMLALAGRSLAALQVLLADQPFLFGCRPCGADATAFAVLGLLLSPHFDSPLRRRAQAFDSLKAYLDRMMALFYPEFPWINGVRTASRAAA